ncbi:MAG: GNAT family N-acetyltransferase [Caulobacterales bacterium]
MTEYRIEIATKDQLPQIVALLADDAIGAFLEDPGAMDVYEHAFDEFRRNPNAEIYVALDEAGKVVGCVQMSVVQFLVHRGEKRVEIAGLRINRRLRKSGLGGKLLRHVLDEGRRRGAVVAQFTSNKARQDAHMFYERMGFKASHDGYKISLK